MNGNRDEFEGAPKIFGVLCPPQVMLYCIFNKEFSKISEIWSFMSGDFFEKFRNISEKSPEIFSTFPKLKKNYYFSTRISSKSLYWSDLAKFSH